MSTHKLRIKNPVEQSKLENICTFILFSNTVETEVKIEFDNKFNKIHELNRDFKETRPSNLQRAILKTIYTSNLSQSEKEKEIRNINAVKISSEDPFILYYKDSMELVKGAIGMSLNSSRRICFWKFDIPPTSKTKEDLKTKECVIEHKANIEFIQEDVSSIQTYNHKTTKNNTYTIKEKTWALSRHYQLLKNNTGIYGTLQVAQSHLHNSILIEFKTKFNKTLPIFTLRTWIRRHEAKHKK